MVGAIVLFGFYGFLFIKESSPNYYLYVFFMVYLWTKTAREHQTIFKTFKSLSAGGRWLGAVGKVLLYVAVLELLVCLINYDRGQLYRFIDNPTASSHIGFRFTAILAARFSLLAFSLVGSDGHSYCLPLSARSIGVLCFTGQCHVH
jgi:hypothetical protein